MIRRAGYTAYMAGRDRIQSFGKRNLKEQDHLEDLGVDSSIMDLKEIECNGIDWKNLAQDMEKWWVLVNIVLNLQVP
jgi:hypothetical protein